MYKLQNNSIKRLADGASIPLAAGNRDYEEYKQWVLEGNTPEPEFTAAELLAKSSQEALTAWKQSRQLQVDNIEVTYNTVIYQGDETSQTRMTRAIVALPDNTAIINWVAKDNTVHALNKVDLQNILALAGTAQSTIWTLGRP